MRIAVPGALEWYIAQHHWPNAIMYHYTSRKALQNILETKRMWATDLRAMNDPHELHYGLELVEQRMKAATKRSHNQLRQTFLRTTYRLFRSLIADQSSSFSISFSEHADLVNQWRDYADDANGYCLAWSIDSHQPEIPLRAFVTYDRKEQRELVDGLIDFHLEWVGNAVAKHGKTPETAFGDGGLSLAMFLNVVTQTTKGSKWAPESEFRYVYEFFKGYEPPEQVFKTRFAEGKEKRYIEANFEDAELRGVLVGPRNDFGTASRWLRELLDVCGFVDTVIMSAPVSVETIDNLSLMY